MTITRLETHPGLTSGPGWSELAYATGSADWPVARLRVVPFVADEIPRFLQPNAPTVPGRVAVRLSASLVDADGQVIRIGGRLLVGSESPHTNQFEAGVFDAAAWLDGCATAVIEQLLRQAAGMAAAHAAGLLPAESI